MQRGNRGPPAARQAAFGVQPPAAPSSPATPSAPAPAFGPATSTSCYVPCLDLYQFVDAKKIFALPDGPALDDVVADWLSRNPAVIVPNAAVLNAFYLKSLLNALESALYEDIFFF